MKTRFTLVELGVIVGCLAVLAGMTLPMSDRAFEIARKSACASNLRQNAMGMLSYSEGHDGWVPLFSNGYYSWFQFSGVPQELGLDITQNLNLTSTRPVTFCPDVQILNNPWTTTICYGTPWIHETSKNDFNINREVEFVIGTPAWVMVRPNILPDPSIYVMLADSAYGPWQYPGTERTVAGNPAPAFYRRDAGFLGVSKRHMDTANLAYADGHVDDSSDKTRIWTKSKIGDLLSNNGRVIEYTWQ